MTWMRQRHRVFQNRMGKRWIAFCPISGAIYSLSSWEKAMKVRGCCSYNDTSRTKWGG